MPAFDLQPLLIGERVELRPLQESDFISLFAVASDPLIWEQHPSWDRYKEDVFRQFFREAMASGGAFLVLDLADGRVIGSSRYAGYDAENGEIEIGWTFLARSHWGGRFNGEMKRLMLDHAFQFVTSVYFVIGPNNIRSRTAVARIGATFEVQVARDGKDVVIYRINKTDWSRLVSNP